MNSNLYETRRIALRQLGQEFTSATASLFHQRFSGPPNLLLTKQAWQHFHEANDGPFDKASKGEWKHWVPYVNGLICSRFYGSGGQDALSTFRRLAHAGVALLDAMSLDQHDTWLFNDRVADQLDFQRKEDAYLLWMEALHLTARRCSTPFLGVTLGNWAYERSPGETIEEAASQMSEPTPFGMVAFPIHPIVETLQQDVFRSSAEAIQVWLGADEVVRVNDWPERPPIYLPRTFPERQQEIRQGDDHGPPSVAAPGEQRGQAASPTSVRPALLVDPETFSVSYREKRCELGNTKEFHLLERLNQRPGIFVRISSLIDDV